MDIETGVHPASAETDTHHGRLQWHCTRRPHSRQATTKTAMMTIWQNCHLLIVSHETRKTQQPTNRADNDRPHLPAHTLPRYTVDNNRASNEDQNAYRI
jgi:hypothetical protein